MAQLKLGAATFSLQPLPDYTTLTRPPGRIASILGQPPKAVYLWSCRSGAGAPGAAPERFMIAADLVPVPRPQGAPAKAISPDKALSRATGLDMPKGVRAEINKVFRPQVVPVPLDTLIDPYKETQSRDLLIHERHACFLATSEALPGEEYLFRLPVAVRFEAVVRWVCSGDGRIGDRMGGEVRLRQSESSAALVAEHGEQIAKVGDDVVAKAARSGD